MTFDHSEFTESLQRIAPLDQSFGESFELGKSLGETYAEEIFKEGAGSSNFAARDLLEQLAAEADARYISPLGILAGALKALTQEGVKHV